MTQQIKKTLCISSDIYDLLRLKYFKSQSPLGFEDFILLQITNAISQKHQLNHQHDLDYANVTPVTVSIAEDNWLIEATTEAINFLLYTQLEAFYLKNMTPNRLFGVVLPFLSHFGAGLFARYQIVTENQLLDIQSLIEKRLKRRHLMVKMLSIFLTLMFIPVTLVSLRLLSGLNTQLQASQTLTNLLAHFNHFPIKPVLVILLLSALTLKLTKYFANRWLKANDRLAVINLFLLVITFISMLTLKDMNALQVISKIAINLIILISCFQLIFIGLLMILLFLSMTDGNHDDILQLSRNRPLTITLTSLMFPRGETIILKGCQINSVQGLYQSYSGLSSQQLIYVQSEFNSSPNTEISYFIPKQ
ncbi:hypothetical protein [Leuconostoc pseudomesenteroides]|uniref:hypothetical protein n=1 Tax=Leuconostoc pseudomesenteroides TaxID=33968 RepID=UPI0040361C72